MNVAIKVIIISIFSNKDKPICPMCKSEDVSVLRDGDGEITFISCRNKRCMNQYMPKKGNG